MKILFLGAGVFGEALSRIVRYNGHETLYYDPYKYPDTRLEDVSKKADLFIYTAPSEKHQEILPILPKDVPIICASKGFLSTKPFLKFKHFSALGGAGFANNIAEDANITFTASSELSENLFSTETVKVEYTTDTTGIILCGALKNIYAIGAGMYGEDNQDNTSRNHLKAYFISVAKEMEKILSANNASSETIKLSCGIPDLVLTCSDDSRNFRFGKNLANHVAPEEGTIEGLSAINSLKDYPEFIIPDDATIISSIIERVKNATE